MNQSADPDEIICPHCGHGVPLNYMEKGNDHVSPSLTSPTLAVGQFVAATEHCSLDCKGQIGLVVKPTVMLNNRPVWTILFENGSIDGWTPCQVAKWLRLGPVYVHYERFIYSAAFIPRIQPPPEVRNQLAGWGTSLS